MTQGMQVPYTPSIAKLSTRLAALNLSESLLASTLGNSIIATAAGISFSDEALFSADKLTWGSNGGVASNTSALMLARINTDVPASAQVCLFMEGPNDAGGSVTVATHRANFEAIIQNLLGRGITPVLLRSTPRNSYGTITNGYVAAENALALKYGVSIYDPWIGVTVDTTTGEPVSGSTGDGVHPTLANGRLAKANLVSYLNGAVPDAPFAPRSNSAGSAGYCLIGGNCFMLTDTNADGVPDGWTKSGGATGSNPSAPGSFSGKMMRLTGSGSGGGTSNISKAISTGWQAGDQLLLSCVLHGDTNTVASGSISCGLNYDSGTSLNIAAGSIDPIPAHRVIRRFTPLTTAAITASITVNNGGTGNYIEIGELEIFNLTALLTR